MRKNYDEVQRQFSKFRMSTMTKRMQVKALKVIAAGCVRRAALRQVAITRTYRLLANRPRFGSNRPDADRQCK